jgi:hypothetical protein
MGKQSLLHFEAPEIIFDLTSIGLEGEIVKTKNSLLLIFNSGTIDLLSIQESLKNSCLTSDTSLKIMYYDVELDETLFYNVDTNIAIFQKLLLTLFESAE